MKIRPGFGRVVDAYARGEEISVRCTDDECFAHDHSASGIPRDLHYVGAAGELSVEVEGTVFWSGSTEVVE